MKKTLTTLAIMGAMISSASAGTVALAPAPAPVATPTPSSWISAVEVEAVSALADQSTDPNMYGPRFTYALYKQACANFTHEMNFSIAFLWGDEGKAMGAYYLEQDAFTMPMMVGYNLNYDVTDKLSAFAGLKMGASIVDQELTIGSTAAKASMTDRDTDLGFIWSVGTGLKYDLQDNLYIKLSYEFSRVYTDMHYYDMPSEEATGMHVISLGVGMTF